MERRRYPRQQIDRPAKLFHEETLRYTDARACDLSAGGALVEVRMARAFLPGDRVRVAFDWLGKGVLEHQAMIPATIVRAEPEADGRRRLALAFEHASSARSTG